MGRPENLEQLVEEYERQIEIKNSLILSLAYALNNCSITHHSKRHLISDAFKNVSKIDYEIL